MHDKTDIKLAVAGICLILIGAGLALNPKLSVVGAIFLVLGFVLLFLSDPLAFLR